MGAGGHPAATDFETVSDAHARRAAPQSILFGGRTLVSCSGLGTGPPLRSWLRPARGNFSPLFDSGRTRTDSLRPHLMARLFGGRRGSGYHPAAVSPTVTDATLKPATTAKASSTIGRSSRGDSLHRHTKIPHVPRALPETPFRAVARRMNAAQRRSIIIAFVEGERWQEQSPEAEQAQARLRALAPMEKLELIGEILRDADWFTAAQAELVLADLQCASEVVEAKGGSVAPRPAERPRLSDGGLKPTVTVRSAPVLDLLLCNRRSDADENGELELVRGGADGAELSMASTHSVGSPSSPLSTKSAQSSKHVWDKHAPARPPLADRYSLTTADPAAPSKRYRLPFMWRHHPDALREAGDGTSEAMMTKLCLLGALRPDAPSDERARYLETALEAVQLCEELTPSYRKAAGERVPAAELIRAPSSGLTPRLAALEAPPLLERNASPAFKTALLLARVRAHGVERVVSHPFVGRDKMAPSSL